MEMASSAELTKIRFQLDPNDWHGLPSETLWAEAVSGATAGSAFRLRNSPMFVCGVSFLDIVRGAARADGEGFEFAGVIDHSGHSTYMLLVPTICPSFEEYWKRLQDLGCTFESKSIKTAWGDRILYAVDVPAETDIYAVYSIFSEGERENIWIFQEGHVGHKLRS